ncbi:MAG TPA: hypothetical protein VL242_53345 [Sorangium sp.]|nr:hypothetical protein [Sorangium sp.]
MSKGNSRNTLVLVAVITLTALCVIGIGALIYMKTNTVQPIPAQGDDVLPAPPAPTSGAATTGQLHSGVQGALEGAGARAVSPSSRRSS